MSLSAGHKYWENTSILFSRPKTEAFPTTMDISPSDARSAMPPLVLRTPSFPSPGVMAGEEASPRTPRERTRTLPSIRQAVPEINDLPPPSASVEYRSNGSTSPRLSLVVPNSSDHVQSPPAHKRRRLSNEEDQELELRERAEGKRYRSPSLPAHRAPSVGISPTDTQGNYWPSSGRSSPYNQSRADLGIRSPVGETYSLFDGSGGFRRPTLPSLTSLSVDRGPVQSLRSRGSVGEYALESSRSGARAFPQMLTSAYEPPSGYHPGFAYGSYQQPRGHSISGPATNSLSHDRMPFSNNHQVMFPRTGFPYSGLADAGNDSKQRKRRGNLPKETTDKLRAWFVAHLQHPYPTEDEKQDLMRETGLQINQISNWFINARRRQLPAMINNARAESDARSAREGDGAVQRGSISPIEESDGEASGYEDDFDAAQQSRQPAMQRVSKRGSI